MASGDRPLASSLGAAALLTAIAFAVFGLSGTLLAHEADGRPARIHEGSCSALGRVTHRLTGVGAEVDLDGTPVPAPEAAGAPLAVPLAVSTTALETKLSDFVETPHAIVVYESDEAMDRTIACADIGGVLLAQMPGMTMPGDQLVVRLAPEHDSPFSGFALVRSEVGGKTTITIILAEDAAGEGGPADDHEHSATPEASLRSL